MTGPGIRAHDPGPRWSRRLRRRIARLVVRARRRTRGRMTAARANRASAALSALLAALMVAAGWLLFIGSSPVGVDPAAKLVTDYLAAVRDGDTEAALDIAGVTRKPDNADFLDREALSPDWWVDTVAAVPYHSEGMLVRVRISDAGGRSTRGEFLVTESKSGPRIANPFAVIAVYDDDAPGYLDLNGTVAGVSHGDDDQATFPVFPGGYELYSKNRSMFSVDPGRMLLLPGKAVELDEVPAQQRLDFSMSLTDKAQKSVHKSLTALIDECAKSDELAPPHCPFIAEDELYDATVTTDDQYFTDVEDITWTVNEYPKVTLNADGNTLRLSSRNDAAITLTGTAIPMFGEDDDKRVDFTVECPYTVGDMVVKPSASGGFTLKAADDRNGGGCRAR